jgi:lipoprotein-releasing system permease protein
MRYSDWAEDHRNLFNAIHIEKMMMRIILMFIVAVAAFNIVASLMMVVIDKQKDIAILRTYGLEPKRVARIFLVQGAMIGFFGTAAGVALGLVCAYNLGVIVPWLRRSTSRSCRATPATSPDPVRVHWFDVADSRGVLRRVLATLYPAPRCGRRARRALRYD